MHRAELADFLRLRREALQPADVGLLTTARRRTPGLRREDAAGLAGMSTDYWARLEQQRGPQPSPQVLRSVARALRLTQDERDHLFRLAGHPAPERSGRSEHVHPALLRVLDRLHDTPAQVVDDLGRTLVQNPGARALLGDQTVHTGLARSAVWRWFTGAQEERAHYAACDHDRQSRVWVADLRAAVGRDDAEPARDLVDELLRASPEFAELWGRHEVAVRTDQRKVLVHAELGEVDLDCQVLHTRDRSQALLVFTTTPGTPDADALALLCVLGARGAGAAEQDERAGHALQQRIVSGGAGHRGRGSA